MHVHVRQQFAQPTPPAPITGLQLAGAGVQGIAAAAAACCLLMKLPMQARLSNARAPIDHSTRATGCHAQEKGLATGFSACLQLKPEGSFLTDAWAGIPTSKLILCGSRGHISPEALGLANGWDHWDGLWISTNSQIARDSQEAHRPARLGAF